MTNQEKIEAAFKDLLEIVIRERVGFCFANPTEYPQTDYGDYSAEQYKIRVFKERTAPLTVWHIYAMAHELQHFRQHTSMTGYNTWFYALDGTNVDDLKEDARLELDADEAAVGVLKKYKIRIPAQLDTFITDRRTHYQSIIG
jgi:hypothetical protein